MSYSLPTPKMSAPPPINGVPATLLYSKSSRQILLLEAGKELVDLILGFLTLPLGCVIRLLTEGRHEPSSIQKLSDQHKPLLAMLNLYESVNKLEDSNMCTGKWALLDPRPANPWGGKLGLLSGSEGGGGGGGGGGFYYCTGSSGPCEYIASKPDQKCPKHNKKMDTLCKIVIDNNTNQVAQSQMQMPKGKSIIAEDGKNKGVVPAGIQREAGSSQTGFVKPEAAYMITNTLEIFPSSTIQSIVKLAALKSERLGDLETIEISIGSEEILQLLKASLNSSNSILNDVFIKFSKKASVSF